MYTFSNIKAELNDVIKKKNLTSKVSKHEERSM